MFYSQFILAKKGPLGTIWIAAHLERKLRKNQVADTDIGVSVDSILFPDMPIALRLSSHLLLGVVRIYSKKVNYLFDDCSETLLKIKQAFRSAAVDLPPEESKAPYHSITLPETFDLDDFELPDNDIFHGNFVDHHISSREQITLQDTMEGVSYSTSKFGLDERFGDGDASGLDLDEELLLDKIGSSEHAKESADPQASAGRMTPVKQDEHPETSTADIGARVDGVDEHADLMDYAQAPCTPGLVEEPNLSNVQEVSACDDHLEPEYHLVEGTMKRNAKNITYEAKQEDDWCSHDITHSDAIPKVLPKENGYQSGGLDVNPSKPHGESPIEANMEHVLVDESSLGSKPTSELADQVKALNPPSVLVDKVIESSDVPCMEDLHNGSDNKDKNSSLQDEKQSHDCQGTNEIGLKKNATEGVSPKNQGSVGVEVLDSTEIVSDLEKSCPNASEDLASKNQDQSCLENPETQARRKPTDSSSFNLDIHEKAAFTETPFLRPCQSNVEQHDITSSGCVMLTDADVQSDVAALATSEREETVMLGKECCMNDNSEELLKENYRQEHTLQDDIHAASIEPDSQVHDANSHDTLTENLNNSAEAELPAPERLLSVPDGLMDVRTNVLVEGSPGEFVGLYDGDAGSKIVSGKKRSFTESTLTEQSLNSVESSRLVRFKRTVESVPDDDDLLSSILAGRSSVLKVKPTPRPSEVTSMKRTRSAPRTGAPKRKVLMDDTMVLHGDTIRQQLMNTEDIRRVRKKAPCTLPEISMIRKQHLEDEIFLEPVSTGMSMELASLHGQTCDLSGIIVCKDDPDGASLEIVAEQRLPSEKDEIGVSMAEQMLTSHAVKNDDSLATAVGPNLTPQNAGNGENLDVENDEDSERLDVTEQNEMRITSEPFLDRDNEVSEPFNNMIKEVAERNVEINISKEQTKPTSDVEADLSQQEPSLDVTGVETSKKDDNAVNSSVIAGSDSFYPFGDTWGDKGDASAGFGQMGSTTENTSMNNDASAVLPDEKTDARHVPSIDIVMDVNNGEPIIRDELMEKDGEINVAVEAEPVVKDDVELPSNAKHEELEYNEHNEIYSVIEGEDITSSSYPARVGLPEDSLLDKGEDPEQPEAYQRYIMDAETSGFDLHDREDLKYSAAGNDTEFLNVDDDELTEIADDHIPDDEEAQFIENTGWSSRTRAVSKYLQTLFVKETEHGRKSLSMNNLLDGKTRKEASRMFFEALVLKTRDYIHVEQQKPFDDITLKPRTRLMKSNF
ncbi:hypothetical protein CDL12_06919 [Handroanthus impetiginosus]|uniref:Sister chromatid cohesion complex Cohesin, subunit RAD21/SCC1 n=1 Tax=Handroanthus impetiginosus TaxID=429701 RepID=A0A2G9HSA6_9LAMI|nr:hypothetical protein CDL12_06919 [Handroanthus impetiginosus]